jgi:hypothetical protein
VRTDIAGAGGFSTASWTPGAPQRSSSTSHSASIAVERAVRKQTRTEGPVKQSPGPSSRTAWLGWATALAASVVLAIMVITPRSPDLDAQLVASHVRSLQPESHLIDVARTVTC